MIIGPKKLLNLVVTQNLIENLSLRELENPEGSGFDLRLEAIYKISGVAFLGIEERKTPKIELKAKYDKSKKKKVIIEPNSFYLVTTIEKINLPLDICATFIPRSTLFRSGLFLQTGVAQPGYRGKLTFGLKNVGQLPVILELGCRFVQALFHKIDGGIPYRGQWQGGRITIEKKEKQI